MNLAAARVFVRDLVVARDFYSQVLGLNLAHDGVQSGYCVFSTGSTDLIVESVPLDAPQEDQDLVGRFTGLSFSVKDVQAQFRSMSQAGVSFTGSPEKQQWGGVIATFQDPAGNELQLVQAPVA